METAPPPIPSADAREALIRQLREELIKTQMIVLELNDRILEKETDRVDAIAILGRVELVLEQKIDYIVELDQALNARIRDLTSALADAQSLAAQRLAEIQRICAERDREYAARDAIIQDLVQKLDTANQEIGRAHTMAGGFARDLAHTRDALAAEQTTHQQTREAFAANRAQLDATAADLVRTQTALAATREELAGTQSRLDATARELSDTAGQLSAREADLAAERGRLHRIKASALWRLGRPWRALFGPKA